MKSNLLIVVGLISSILACNTVEESWYSNGQLEYSVPLKNGKRNGQLMKYYETGEIQYISNWVHGIKEGDTKLFYKNGNVKLIENYKAGQPEGIIKEFDSTGILINQMTYYEGIKTNEKEFFKNGNVKGQIEVINDTSIAHYYYKNGNIEEISVKHNSSLIYGVSYNEKGKIQKSFLPISVGYSSLNDSLDIAIQIEYSMCSECSYLVIIGEINNEGKLIKEVCRETFLQRDMEIRLLKRVMPQSTISGLIYELKGDSVINYSPVNTSL